MTAPFPVVLGDFNDTEGAVSAIHARREELAAVILEPMLGGGGFIPARQEFVEALPKRRGKSAPC